MVAGLSGKAGSGSKRGRGRRSKTSVAKSLHLGKSGSKLLGGKHGPFSRKSKFGGSRSAIGLPSKKTLRTLSQRAKRAKAQMERASELTGSISTMVGLVATAVEVTSAIRGQGDDDAGEERDFRQDDDSYGEEDYSGEEASQEGDDFGDEDEDEDENEQEELRRAG